ncbi:MAG: hypothetical protein LBG96_05485 [Tannerella sp.]|jgi:hypothetical protein|nr:hypothetical protein [Tannerella sp.]
MKRILFLLSAAIMLFASCEGPAGRDGVDGRDGEMSFFVENFRVYANNWIHTGTGKYVSYYEYIAKIDIRDEAYAKGMVNVYIYPFPDENVQAPLPYWVQYTAGDNTWLEGYNYDFDSGTIKFYLDWSNGKSLPAITDFRVVVAP